MARTWSYRRKDIDLHERVGGRMPAAGLAIFGLAIVLFSITLVLVTYSLLHRPIEVDQAQFAAPTTGTRPFDDNVGH